uniref:Polyketide synthase n=1 Tax=Stigmatella aurantiaca Sg a15 TaxID=675526 RepID=A0A097DC83_STIAU|nr:polyketide synthase [Stigmatella aurantiaca Sg a15]
MRQEPMAIIGMGCVLPDAPDVPTFWRNLRSGHVAVRNLAGDRWDGGKYDTSSLMGAPVGDLRFDWKKFKVPPIETRLLHTIEMMVMEAAHQALMGAGYSPERTFARDRVAVIAGSSGMGRKSNQGFNFKWRLPEMLLAAQQTGVWKELSAKQANEVAETVQKDFIHRYIEQSDDWAFWGFMSPVLGRICSLFDLQGPHFCVDAHAASGLAALEVAVQGLMSGEWDMALVGAASPALSPMEYVLHSKLRRLSPSGVFPLDARANGTALGEGAVMLLLKRLRDAEREGDTIHAVLRGVGGVNQGSGPVVTATDAQVHQRAAEETLNRSGVDRTSITYLETGAAGVPGWDAHIISGLASAYQRAQQVSLGAVAESVGDLQTTSSLAAMLKVIHSLQNRTLIPQRTFQTQHPEIPLEGTPFQIHAEPSWPEQGPLRAGIHASGFGGVAYHAVLEAYSPEGPRASVYPVAPKPSVEPIAIVGLACRYPGADSAEALWENALHGRNAVTDIPEERWPVPLYHDGKRPATRGKEAFFRVYAPKSALVEDKPFPFMEFGIPPATVSQMDRSQRWCLEIARDALRDAGQGAQHRVPLERTAVIVATTPGNHQEVMVEAQLAYPEFAELYRQALLNVGVPAPQVERFITEARGRFQGQHPPTTSETLPGLLNSAPATRLARALNARGPAFTVESACASTLAALSLSIQGLRDGRWDAALAGGVWSQITAPYCVNMCFVGAVSPTGETRPFSKDADGFVHGEGCGMFVLKRLSDAKRDGDRIHAVIVGMGASTDGRGKSIFASQERGQELAMRRALADSRVEPSSIQYVEAHASGMPEGDIPEAGALLKVYGRQHHPVAVGALKPLIGHSYIASGAAGLIRTVLALQRRTLPPIFTGSVLNPNVPWNGQLVFHREPRGWPSPEAPRRAAVNAYGFGGTNYHVVLEEYVE